MSYPKQDKVIERLENQAHNEIKRIREEGRKQLQYIWESTKTVLRQGIMEFYRRDFGRSTWNIIMAARQGTFHRIDTMAWHILSGFHQESISLANSYFREIYKQTVLRWAYILDMTTPDSYKIKFPHNRMFMEAEINDYQGPDAETAWKVRWSAWLDAYRSSLNNNLRMGAMNDSTMQDAADEVDQTRAGSPAYDTGDALDRIYMSQVVFLIAQAGMDLSSVNEDLDLEEIWQTSFSARVCDICDSQQGLTHDEAEEDIPAHPNCECYWRLVPPSWAKLLRNGDEDEIELAKWMDAKGLISSSMVIRDDEGNPAGRAVITFNDWVKDKSKTVSGGIL